jgi:hypothetical protein
MSTIVNLQQIPHTYLTIELMKPENLPHTCHVMSQGYFVVSSISTHYMRACCLLQFDISVRYQLM